MSIYARRDSAHQRILNSLKSQLDRVQSDLVAVRDWKLNDQLTQLERDIQKSNHILRLRYCLFTASIWSGLRKGLINLQRVSLKYQNILDPDEFFESKDQKDDVLSFNLLNRPQRQTSVEVVVDRNRRLAIGELRLDGIRCLSDVNPDEILGPLSTWAILTYRVSLLLDFITTLLHIIARANTRELKENFVPYECILPKYTFLPLKYPSLNSWCAITIGTFNVVSRLTSLLRDKFELDVIIFMLSSYEQIQANMVPEKAKQRFESMGSLNVIQKVLYYKYQSPRSDIEFRLRPNRSWETKRLLHKLLHVMSPMLTMLATFFLYLLLYVYVSISDFDSAYTGCNDNPQMFQFNPTGFDRFRMIITNIIYSSYVTWQSISCYWSLLFVCGLAFYDINLYRNDIESRLHRVEKAIDDLIWLTRSNNNTDRINSRRNSFAVPTSLKSKRHQLSRQNSIIERKPLLSQVIIDSIPEIRVESMCSDQEEEQQHEPNSNIDADELMIDVPVAASLLEKSIHEQIDKTLTPQEEIADFQARVTDFFQNVNRFDQLISHTIGCLFIVWVVVHVSLTIMEINRGWISGFTKTKWFQVSTVPTLMAICRPALTFNRRNIVLYKQICTFMARDPTRSKTNWIGVLRFYTDEPRYAFTLFGIEVLSNQMFLKLTSYILSFTSFMATADFGKSPEIR